MERRHPTMRAGCRACSRRLPLRSRRPIRPSPRRRGIATWTATASTTWRPRAPAASANTASASLPITTRAALLWRRSRRRGAARDPSSRATISGAAVKRQIATTASPSSARRSVNQYFIFGAGPTTTRLASARSGAAPTPPRRSTHSGTSPGAALAPPKISTKVAAVFFGLRLGGGKTGQSWERKSSAAMLTAVPRLRPRAAN